MQCVDVSSLVVPASGSIYTRLAFGNGQSVLIPYRFENLLLLGNNLELPGDYRLAFVSDVQHCPFCTAPLHLTHTHAFCYNVNCVATRLSFIQKQLSILNIVISDTVKFTAYLLEDSYIKTRDLFDVLKDSETLFGIDLYQQLKTLTIEQYLGLIRISTDYHDEHIAQLENDFDGSLNNFINSVNSGVLFTEQSKVVLSQDIKDAILFSYFYVNKDFAVKIAKLANCL